MKSFFRFCLALLCGPAAFTALAAELSPESAAFLAARPNDAQIHMANSVRQAINGDFTALERARAAMRNDTPPPEGIRVENTTVSGRNIRFYQPDASMSASIVLYLHGGGWTVGGIEGSSRLCGDLAKRLGMDVATLDYRLAPEAKAPAALDDVLAAAAQLQKRGYRRIYLAGDSAGGNLAAAAAWKLRSKIAGIVLFYPVTLARNDQSESWRNYGRNFGLDGELMEAFNAAYAPGKFADDPAVSPLLATEFAGYPTTRIVAAECDVLRDQGKAFAEILEKHHIAVEYTLVPGALHAFMTYPDMELAYQTGLNAAVDFIQKQEQKAMTQVTGESIVRLSVITVDPARLEEYLKFAAECGRISMAEEPGVLMMYSMADKLQPNRITILEIYADSDAYKKHIKTAHFQKYKQGTLPMVQKLELLDQTPLVPEMKMK